MNRAYVSLDQAHPLSKAISENIGAKEIRLQKRQFPDGETYLRFKDSVGDIRQVILFADLAQPDNKILPLIYTAQALRENGVEHIQLIAPYLPYMRQDKRFIAGEVITSIHFASVLSTHVDSLITVDPHLHRYHSLDEIYQIPTMVLHAADAISDWVKSNCTAPVFIGPDSESEQWVKNIASALDAPYLVLEKVRRGDDNVSVSIPKLKKYSDLTPVLIDDIISTGRTMIETINHLTTLGTKPPVCIGVHAIFANDSYQDLKCVRTETLATCNTIDHPTNCIDLSRLLIKLI